MQRAHTDERGAVAVLVGVLLPMLLGMSALGFATLTMAGGERELQRAADAGALSAASRLELASLTGIVDPTVSDLLPAVADVQSVGCGVAEDNLAAAALTSGFADTVTCSVKPATFRDNLATVLDQGLGLVPTEALDALNQVVDVPALLPAIATPYVEVTTGSDLDPPLRGLLSPTAPGDMEVSALARRRLKNAVLAPVVDVNGVPVVDDTTFCSGTLLGVPFTDPLSDILDDLTKLGGLDSCRFNPNQPLGIPRDPVLDALDDLANALPTELAPAADAIRELRTDFYDLYNPPDGSDAPTQWDIIDAAASNNEDVLVILADQSTASSLLSGLIGASRVPVLDAVIVPAVDLANGTVDVNDELTDVAAARGIFRATLVRR